MTTRRALLSGGLVIALSGIVLSSGAAAQSGSAGPPADRPPATRSLAVPSAASPSPAAASGPQLSSAQSSPVQTLGAQARAVVELFTSQGCSSCPAADRVLAQLKKDPTLIAVSLPVTYWDYLGWKDTLADPRHTARQAAYSHARGDRAVYTPQVIVNGALPVLGSDKAAIEGAMAKSRARGVALSVPVRLSVADGKVLVSTEAPKGGLAAAVATAGPAAVATDAPAAAMAGEVWLLGVSSAVEVAVRRGENNGRTIVYSNVVRRWHKLGDWTGDPRAWAVPVGDVAGDTVDAVAVLIQGGSSTAPGIIYGAAFERLK